MPFLYAIQTLMHENSLWRTRHAIKKRLNIKLIIMKKKMDYLHSNKPVLYFDIFGDIFEELATQPSHFKVV